jgi:hypothetical protein
MLLEFTLAFLFKKQCEILEFFDILFFNFFSPHFKPRELFRPIFILLNEDTKHKCKVDCHRENVNKIFSGESLMERLL